jgi:hypothetical protein
MCVGLVIAFTTLFGCGRLEFWWMVLVGATESGPTNATESGLSCCSLACWLVLLGCCCMLDPSTKPARYNRYSFKKEEHLDGAPERGLFLGISNKNAHLLTNSTRRR